MLPPLLQVDVNEVHTLYSNQEETDTRVILYLHHAVNMGFKSAVVRTPDTDIFFILLRHSHTINLTIYLDTGTGKKRRLIDVSTFAKSLGSAYCTTLLGFYVYSGEDCTSAFRSKGKVTPLKKLQKNPKYQKSFE